MGLGAYLTKYCIRIYQERCSLPFIHYYTDVPSLILFLLLPMAIGIASCIARAIAKRPRILLCDEPTGALDPENSLRVMKILKGLVEEQHIAVVMITHNTAFRSLADHCIVLSAGEIIEDVHQPFPCSADSLQLR